MTEALQTGRDAIALGLSEMAMFPEMNPGPVCRLDRSGVVLLANTAAKNFFGESNLLGRSWFELCPGINDEKWNEILACKGIYAIEGAIGDTWMHFAHVCRAPLDFVFVYGTDITANKLAEKKLAEQAATIAEIARFPDMNPGPVLRLDLDGRVLLSNAAAAHVFGDDLTGSSWLAICPGMEVATWKRIVLATDVVPIEVRMGEKTFVFSHRRDFATNLVFVFGADITLQKLAERGLRQSEKMATLGTLAAGIAHELNNPAAATRRASLQLGEAFTSIRHAFVALNQFTLTETEHDALRTMAGSIEDRAGTPATSALSSIERSDLEVAVEEWLDEREIESGWSFAPSLVAGGIGTGDLDELSKRVRREVLSPILGWLAAIHPVYALLYEIAEGSGRISEIVVAMKNYSYLGQAPVQNVNVHEGIDNTLIILRSKLKSGIVVHREYAPDLPPIAAYGSELNQVWTNLIDNATDAMRGTGELWIRTRRDGTSIAVEITDNGPGISEEIQHHVFDPFFTTKEPGKGTGLGLSTSYGIITEKHGGTIHLKSRPGCTTFTVRLPVGGSETVSQ